MRTKQLNDLFEGVPTKCQKKSRQNFSPGLKTGCIPEPDQKPLELFIERLKKTRKIVAIVFRDINSK